MKIKTLAAFLFLGVAAACVAPSPAERDRQAAEELTRIEAALPEAVLRRDTAALERVLADDFLGVNPVGKDLTRADVIAQITSPEAQWESLRHEDIRVRVFGDCAVVTARSVVKARHQGREASGRFRYLRVWVRRQGRWQAVAAQSTSIPQSPPQ